MIIEMIRFTSISSETRNSTSKTTNRLRVFRVGDVPKCTCVRHTIAPTMSAFFRGSVHVTTEVPGRVSTMRSIRPLNEGKN